MAVPISPTAATYTQPSVSNTAQRDTVSILADGRTQVIVQRRDVSGNVLESVRITVPQTGGVALDDLGRSYGSVIAGSAFMTAVETICTQVDSAVAAFAAAGKFNR